MAEDTALKVTVNTESVPAQVAGKPQDVPTENEVHEVTVNTDRVILDTSDPLAVQVPEAGKGDASTPIGRAFGDPDNLPETPNEAFGDAPDAADTNEDKSTTASLEEQAKAAEKDKA